MKFTQGIVFEKIFDMYFFYFDNYLYLESENNFQSYKKIFFFSISYIIFNNYKFNNF